VSTAVVTFENSSVRNGKEVSTYLQPVFLLHTMA